MSSGCKMEVTPPGITTVSVRPLWSFFFTSSLRWPRKLSRTNIAFCLRNAPGPLSHTLSTQSFTKSWSIHPFSCTRTWNPGGNFSFGRVFLLKITYGGNLPPSAVTANITVHLCFSAPVVFIDTDRTPCFSIEVFLDI